MEQQGFKSEQLNDEHFRLLVESARHYAIFGIDLEGRVNSWNPGAERIKGWKAEEIIGRHFEVLFLPHQRESGRPQFEMQYALEKGVYIGEEPRLRKDGTVFDAEVALHLIRGPDGQPAGFAKVTEDITDQKQAQRDAESRREFLQQLVAIVGHDLRNPLGAILLSTELLRTRLPGDEHLLALVSRVTKAATRSARIVDDLLDLSQTQLLGTIPISPTKVDFALYAKQVVEEHQASHPDRDLRLDVRGDAVGTWDSQRLMQALSNLLSNALQHGEVDKPVTVEVHEAGDAITVAVHNWGPPIPESLRADLFKPFRRGGQPSTTEKSLGLGLHIVDRIVDAHGGSVELESTADRGTRFRFTIPKSERLARA